MTGGMVSTAAVPALAGPRLPVLLLPGAFKDRTTPASVSCSWGRLCPGSFLDSEDRAMLIMQPGQGELEGRRILKSPSYILCQQFRVPSPSNG